MLTKADAVVIGGGITGCSIAYNLSKRGKRVVVLEKDDVAYEASGRTVAAVGLLGKQAGEFELARESLAIYDGLSEDIGYEIEFVKKGRLLPAESAEDMPYFEEMVEAARDGGIQLEMLTTEQVRTRFPVVEGHLEAMAYSADEGHVNPTKVVNGFANAARENGAEIRTGCVATNIGVTGGRVSSVETTQGEIETGVVVLAAGVWAYRLADRMGVHIPVQIVTLSQGETGPAPPIIEQFVRGGYYCFRQTASGPVRVSNGYRRQDVYHELSLHDLRDLKVWLPRLIKQRKSITMRVDMELLKHDVKFFLASMQGKRSTIVAPVGKEPRKALNKVTRQFNAAGKLIPKLRQLKIERSWAGYIDTTPDLVPVLGPAGKPEGLYLSMGYSGHGFGLGPVAGKLTADLIVDGKSSIPWQHFSVDRFKNGNTPMPTRLM